MREIWIKCSNQEHKYIDSVCLNKNCKANRVYCEKTKEQDDHLSHHSDQIKFEDLIVFLQKIEKETENLIEKLSLKAKQIFDSFTHLIKELRNKYQFSKEKLSGFNAKQLNSTIDLLVKYDDYHTLLFQQVKECSDQIINLLQVNIKDESNNYEINKQEQDKVEELYQKGQKLQCEDYKCQDAIKLLDDTLLIDQKNVKQLSTKADSLRILGKYNDAITLADKALSINSNNVCSLFIKAESLRMLGKCYDAILWADKALAIDSKHFNSIYTKADSLKQLGKYDDAIIWADKALQIYPKNANLLYIKAASLQMLGKYNDAITLADKALQIDSNNVYLLYVKGESLRRLHKYNEALNILDQSLHHNPNFESSLASKGACLQSLQKYQEAIDKYNKIIQINPNCELIKINQDECEEQLHTNEASYLN